MDNKLNFFTAVTCNKPSFSESLLQNVDAYFNPFGKEVAKVQPQSWMGHKVVLIKQSSNTLHSFSTLLKISVIIASYFTIIIPLFMLTAKIALRFTYTYYIITPEQNSSVNNIENTLSNSQETLQNLQREAKLAAEAKLAEEIFFFKKNQKQGLQFQMKQFLKFKT